MCQGVIDALADSDITLILKVKKNVIERVSRMFDLPIIASIDSVAGYETPAPSNTCVRFRSRSVPLIPNKKKKSLVMLHRYVITTTARLKSVSFLLVIRRGNHF